MKFTSTLKLFFIVVFAILFAFILIFWGLGSFVSSVFVSQNEEFERIDALAEVSGQICSDNNLIAPLSGDSVAFYHLAYYYRYISGAIRNRSISGRESYFPSRNNFCLAQDAKSYPLEITSKTHVLLESAVRQSEWNTPRSLALSQSTEIPPNLIGITEKIDCMIFLIYKKRLNKELDIACSMPSTEYTTLEIREYSWKKGDSIRLKGEITDDELRLLW